MKNELNKFLLDFDRAESVFGLFFTFLKDTKLIETDQNSVESIIKEIFFGVSLSKPIKQKLNKIYHKVLNEDEDIDDICSKIVIQFAEDRILLLSIIKILIKITFDDAMISKTDRARMTIVLNYFALEPKEFELLSDYEQDIIEYYFFNSSLSNNLINQNNVLNRDYQNLGCSIDSTNEEIKDSYRSLLKELHPDRSKITGISFGNEQSNRLQMVKKSYNRIKKARDII